MIEANDLFSIPFYKKTYFSGSYSGMRYRIEKGTRKEDSGESTVLKATIFPGPYCFDAVPEENKLSAEFEFSDAGIAAACDWLNEQYCSDKKKWDNSHI